LIQPFPTAALPEGKAARLDTLSSNNGAYSTARNALDVSILDWSARRSYQSLLSCYRPSWGNRHVFLLDGTTVMLYPNAVLKKAFPPASNQHGQANLPILHLLVAHELASGLAIDHAHGPRYGPNARCQLDLARQAIPRLPENAMRRWWRRSCWRRGWRIT
jgi:hypothetical protein